MKVRKFLALALAEKNPVLAPGQSCTAEVFSKCRSGNPDSSLKYKWFIYRDNEYSGKSPWVQGVTIVKEYEYEPSIYGRGMSLDEDAGASLFKDRTLSRVESGERCVPFRLVRRAYRDVRRERTLSRQGG